ncbi:DUF3549 family protein [Microbulbifer sp. CAU 1566]|uniref:DUF3549 family protein n=1 Tax=Microbulbifer sp. CAU 1566 TaxID=2933269 RepID=UPI00200377BF|nr:DUF3549 family protein [Microbulbifer sp. CAU 1566]MCK7598228.1 DUF3549 family protein [Microbulbifer sp. CAU 1566]
MTSSPLPPSTLSEFIAAADFNLRWFDLGRRVTPISKKDSDAFEAGTAPWPSPYLRQAWCGLLLWPVTAKQEENAKQEEKKQQEASAEPIVWFLRLPLDEQGKLLLPIRDRFLKQLQQALQPAAAAQPDKDQSRDPGKQLQRALDDSGLMFAPPPERRAVFHAKSARFLKRPASDHYPAAKAYAKDPAAFPWEQLAVQGIADLAMRWKDEQANLANTLPRFATPVLIPLCQCLESEAIDHPLAEPLIRRAEQSLASDQPDINLITAVVRGLSHSPAKGMRQQFLLRLLQSEAATEGEILAAIGSRCCDDLLVPEIAQLWLERLSSSQPQETFNLLLTDLLFLPQLRNVLLGVLRNPERPEPVAKAFGNFLHPGGSS